MRRLPRALLAALAPLFAAGDGSWISDINYEESGKTLWSFSPFTVFFDDRGRVTKVTANEETLAKVYLE